jgi:single-strand DNA-binding protein
MNLNQVNLVGRLARDAEVRMLTTGTPVCSFTLVTNQFFLKEGKKVEQPEFHAIAAFGKTAELIGQYGKKGRLLMVMGHLRTSAWEKDGQKHARTEIVAERVQLGPKAERKPEPAVEIIADPGQESEAVEAAVMV